jgi:hypothetical protein
MLDSPQAWSAAKNEVGEWMQMDLGASERVAGVVVQGRKEGLHGNQYVKSFTIRYSTDGSTWQDVPDWKFNGGSGDTKREVRFPSVITARYVRLVVESWNNHISMRAGIILREGNKNKGTS